MEIRGFAVATELLSQSLSNAQLLAQQRVNFPVVHWFALRNKGDASDRQLALEIRIIDVSLSFLKMYLALKVSKQCSASVNILYCDIIAK